MNEQTWLAGKLESIRGRGTSMKTLAYEAWNPLLTTVYRALAKETDGDFAKFV